MISHILLAGLDYYSQIRHTRRTLSLLTDLSFCRTWIFTPLVELVGAVSNRQQFAVTAPGYLTYRFLAYGIC